MKPDVVNNDISAPSLVKLSKVKVFFFWCLLVIITLIIMELLSFTIIKLTSRKGPYRNTVKQVLSPFHPYLGYVHAPNVEFKLTKGLSRVMSIRTDENGYSITPWFSYENPDIKIIVTGGSTIFGVGSSDNKTTVPSILERLINERLNIQAEVVNLALRGAQSFQEMLIVDRFFAENQADFVLAISGRNDAARAFFEPTVEGAFHKKRIWDNAVNLVHRAERGEFMVMNMEDRLRSILYTYDFLYRLLKPFKKSNTITEQPALNIRKESLTNTRKRAKITATHFSLADQISKMNGATFVMFLQPTPYHKDHWTEEEKRRITIKYEKKYKELYESKDLIIEYGRKEQEFYNEFREIEKPFKLIDLSNIFTESNETLYIDQCHYNDLAAEKLAEKIFASIQPFLHRTNDR